MQQTIREIPMYVVEFDTMPELPITGLTEGEEAYRNAIYCGSYPHGFWAGLVGEHNSKRPTYAQALTNAIETGIITEPGKYGIHLVPGTDRYDVYRIDD